MGGKNRSELGEAIATRLGREEAFTGISADIMREVVEATLRSLSTDEQFAADVTPDELRDVKRCEFGGEWVGVDMITFIGDDETPVCPDCYDKYDADTM